MRFGVEFSRRASRELAALDRSRQLRVLAKLEEASTDPARFFMPLKGVDGFRMRVGDLRVLADIDAKAQVIVVAAIGKRENIYK